MMDPPDELEPHAKKQQLKEPSVDSFYKKLAHGTEKAALKENNTSMFDSEGSNEGNDNNTHKVHNEVGQRERKRKLETEKIDGKGPEGAAALDTGSPMKFELIHKRGDLFSCPETESLAHCVSRDLRMGKGIAKLFKKKFQGVEELKRQGKGIGDVAVLKQGERFIYYLITKEKYSDKPTYESLRNSLLAMKEHLLINSAEKISMPRIGCGLDMLEWSKVELILKQVFGDMEVLITIYSL